VRHDLEARIERIHDVTQDLVSAASHNAAPQLLEDIRRREPRLAAIVRTGRATENLPDSKGALAAAPDRIAPGFQGLFKAGESYYIGANVQAAQGNAEAFTYLPLDDETLASLTAGAVAVPAVIGGNTNTNIAFSGSGSRLAINEQGARKAILSTRVPPAKGLWDVSVATLLSFPMRIAPGEDTTVLLPVLSRPSRLLEGVVAGRMGSIIASVLVIIVGIFAVVELVSLVSSFSITRAITRSSTICIKARCTSQPAIFHTRSRCAAGTS
jgi:hypothetical protein